MYLEAAFTGADYFAAGLFVRGAPPAPGAGLDYFTQRTFNSKFFASRYFIRAGVVVEPPPTPLTGGGGHSDEPGPTYYITPRDEPQKRKRRKRKPAPAQDTYWTPEELPPLEPFALPAPAFIDVSQLRQLLAGMTPPPFDQDRWTDEDEAEEQFIIDLLHRL